MSVDTEIKGKPGEVESAASWLRDKLTKELGDAADEFNGARKDATSTWNSSAGDAFASTMKTAREKTDDLASSAKDMAADLDKFAGSMRTCQNDMKTIRDTASTAGLVVSGFTISDPGPAPQRPPATYQGTKTEVENYKADVKAYNDHMDLVRAYNTADREAARIDRKFATACRALQEKYTPGQHASWILTLTDLTGKGALAALATSAGLKNRSKLLKRASDLVDEAGKAIDELQRNPERYLKRKWFFFKKVDTAKLNADKLAIEGKLNEAESLLKRAGAVDAPPPDGKLPKGLKVGGKILGPLGVGLGVYNDYQEGESTTQIAVSQGGALLAGMGTGAAVGAAVGSVVPVAGTAVGAVVGAVVGAGVSIFADGAIDSFFENGPDVGKALSEGWNSIEDTGGAIKDGVGAGIKKLGGLFD